MTHAEPEDEPTASITWQLGDHYVYVSFGPGYTVHLYHHLVGEGKWEGVGEHDDPRLLKQLAHAFNALASTS
jgi:hypothetical protein